MAITSETVRETPKVLRPEPQGDWDGISRAEALRRLLEKHDGDQQPKPRASWLQRLGFVVVLVGLAPSAQAQGLFTKADAATLGALVGGQAADAWSTHWFLNNGSGSGCVESNPRLGPYPTDGQLVKQKVKAVAIVGGVSLLVRLLGSDHVGGPSSPKQRRIARWGARGLELALAGTGSKSAIRNYSLCR